MNRFSRGTSISEWAGFVLGVTWSPLFVATSAMRSARTFHPCGDLVDARAEIDAEVTAQDRPLAERLTGNALLRFSDALTKGKARWPDVLGCALRIYGAAGNADQDLLFATIKRPWTMLFAPLTTRVHSYLANDYFAVSPFSAPERPFFYLRLQSFPATTSEEVGGSSTAEKRRARLAHAVEAGDTRLRLGVSESPFGPFRPLISVRMLTLQPSDPPDLRFDPFLNARAVTPRGFIHALRRGVYSASQLARPGN